MPTKTKAAEIRTEEARVSAAGMSLANDARYWDLRRTHGDASDEVLSYLRSIRTAVPS